MDFLVQNAEPSPLGEGHIRLHLAGDALPETYSEEPRQAKLWYEAVYDESFPYRGIRVTIVDPENDGEIDAWKYHYQGIDGTDSFSVIHDGAPPSMTTSSSDELPEV